MRSLRQALVYFTGVLIKKGQFSYIDAHTGRISCEDEGRDQGVVCTSWGMPPIASKPLEAVCNDTEEVLSHGPQKEPTLPISWFWAPSFQNCKTYISVVKATQLMVLSYSSPGKLVQQVTMGTCSIVQSCPTLCGPMNCRPSGCCVHGISEAKILGRVTISYSRGSSQPSIDGL